MKKPWLQWTVPQALALTAVLTFASAPAARAQDSGQSAAPVAGQRSDGQIEMDVVKALDDSQALKDDLITAATIQSQVTLAGTVSSDASKQLAESIVSKVPGVSKVNNQLKIGNPTEDPNAQAAPQSAEPEPAQGDNNGAPQNPPQYAQGPDQQGAAPQQQAQPNYPPQNNPPEYSQNAPQGGYPPPPPFHGMGSNPAILLRLRAMATGRSMRRLRRGIPFPMAPLRCSRGPYCRSGPQMLSITSEPKREPRLTLQSFAT